MTVWWSSEKHSGGVYKKQEKSKKSQALGMTKERATVSSRVVAGPRPSQWLEFSSDFP
jgi:hypothetical protein